MSRIVDQILAKPIIYDAWQFLVGARSCHARFISDMVRPASGERILDLGCGVGASVQFLPNEISYVGIDVSAPYIELARAKYGNWGKFICADVTQFDPATLGHFDKAFSFGVLHHLSDEQAARAMDLIQNVVRRGGTFTTIDPCYLRGQHALAKLVIDNDRGKYVRDQAGFERLFSDLGTVRARLFHDLLRIPYTQIVMEVILDPVSRNMSGAH
jgi:SAM-dependent methyltransferase